MNPLIYAKLASGAYTTKPTFGDEDSAARAIVSETVDGQCISIPGTNNFSCVEADIDIEIVETEHMGMLHDGFYKAYMSIRSQLMLCSPDVITGHSEGASIAILYFADLCLAGRPPKALFAFEPARVSIDAQLARIFDLSGSKAMLTWYGEDLVPCIPRILHNWQHPAPLTRVGSSFWERLPIPIVNIEDHAIGNLVKFYTDNPTEI